MRALVALALVAACKYADPGIADAGDGPMEELPPDSAFVVVHETLDGSSTKVAVVQTLDISDEIDLSGARTFGANTKVFMAGDKVFVATDRTIRRFAVVDYTLVEEPPAISFVTTNVMTFSDRFSVFDDTHAWYFDQNRQEAYALDLEAMTSSTAIFYTSLNFSEFVPRTTGAYAVNDTVYVPYYFVNPNNPLFIESEMYVAQFSLSGQQLITTTSATSLRSNRCARSHPFARMPDDTLVFLGDSGSLYDLITPQLSPNCLVRITSGVPDGIDSGFYQNMDDLTSPELSATRPVQSGLTVYTWARDMSHFMTQAEWDAGSIWSPQITTLAADLSSVNTEQLTDSFATIGAPGQTFIIEGAPWFQIPQRDDSEDGSTLFAEHAGVWTRRAKVPGTIKLIERVR